MTKQRRQYGTWPSPISAAALSTNLRLSDVAWDTDNDTLVWFERRGKSGVLVMQAGQEAMRDLTDTKSVGARVGYGGGDFTVHGGYVYFAGPDGRLYRQALESGDARAITPAFGHAAAPAVSPNGEWLVYVHSYERTDGLAIVDSNGDYWPRKLAFGTDFVMQPVWHPAGGHIAYIAWNHPQMPWDGTELRLLTFDDDLRVASIDSIVGDETTAIFQPAFSPDGRYLSYISDATGWGQLYLYDLELQSHHQLTDAPAEHGTPAWIQGLRMYGWAADGQQIYYLRNEGGVYSLWVYDIQSGSSQQIDALSAYTALDQPAISSYHGKIALIASSSSIAPRIISYVPDTQQVRIHRRATTESLSTTQLASAEAIVWPGHDGEDAHGLYYPPTHDSYEGIGTPPLLVLVHGGPTSQRTTAYDSGVQFFTSRGFAVLQVNHRGSTGYGKAYMNKLRGNWGIYDVEDSVTGATYLVAQGLADTSKIMIMGGSAGGFTVLQSLVTKPGFYKAGICLYGVSNHFLLAQDTHKFEERYLDSMLGPLPEAADVYRERSPIFHADRIVDPMIVFQGSDDEVVPQNQSDLIVESLRSRGIPHEYHIYEGEGHGFRKPEHIEHMYNHIIQFVTQHVIYA
ncbi:MAG: S9 family peptidase [Chloroflexi bacterium]|nr:MAG: S9 family peptidase [Chloroflexota bacterium]